MNMKLICFLLIAFLVACSDSDGLHFPDNLDPNAVEISLPGMSWFKTDSVVFLGTNDTSAKASERPQMKVFLNYKFSLGKHEVTCAEFNALMTSSTGLALNCSSDNIPATNMTYYDAVLFANERSKAAGFDTAYTYLRAQFDSENHCTSLNGFAFHPEKKAYRLPTEAEWVAVARDGWKKNGGWTSENSDYKLHEICTESDNNANFCDMLGNAMEWVNDWNGSFRDTVLTNYVGAPDGGVFGMRVVKGGGYRNLLSTINLYRRGDIYTVTSSTRLDYVGFRLAFGAIPDAVWMGSDGNAVTSRIVQLASSTDLRSLTGTYKVKLAFRNDLSGNLAFIDYSNGVPSVIEIMDSIDVYHPEISPDGKKVAFCTMYEGISGKSELYVRDLDASGANLVKLGVESAAIPRWRVIGSDTVIVYVSDAGNNKDDALFMSASTWQVKFSNGKFGEPKKMFDGAYHGGVSEINTLAVSGARLLRARIAKTDLTVAEKAIDTIWYKNENEAEQACNASLAKDSSKRTLFLDFGGKTGQKFVGKKYATHERLLVADSTGKLIQSVASPEGFTFDHSEWASGARNIAVASLTNANGAHSKIILVNLSDSSFVELAEGEELWHPCLWVKKDYDLSNSSLNLDSAGVYFKEGQDWAHISLGYKMSLLWKYRDDIEVLCVGSSRTENSLIVTEMASGFSLNMGHSGNDMNASLYIAENYGINHLKKLKYVVVSLDFDIWQNSTEYTDMLIKKTPGYVYDANHDFWTSGLPDGFLKAVEQASQYSDVARKVYDPTRGYFAVLDAGWGPASVELDSNWHGEAGLEKVEWNINRLKQFIIRMGSFDIKVVGLIFPLNPGYRETGAWGPYGLKRSMAKNILDTLKTFEGLYPNFTVMDENKNGNHDYSDDCASSTDHLGAHGAAKITLRLDSLLKTLK